MIYWTAVWLLLPLLIFNYFQFYCDINYDPFLVMQDEGLVYGESFIASLSLDSRRSAIADSYRHQSIRFHALTLRVH